MQRTAQALLRWVTLRTSIGHTMTRLEIIVLQKATGSKGVRLDLGHKGLATPGKEMSTL
jgi:hypothetical protein